MREDFSKALSFLIVLLLLIRFCFCEGKKIKRRLHSLARLAKDYLRRCTGSAILSESFQDKSFSNGNHSKTTTSHLTAKSSIKKSIPVIVGLNYKFFMREMFLAHHYTFHISIYHNLNNDDSKKVI